MSGHTREPWFLWGVHGTDFTAIATRERRDEWEEFAPNFEVLGSSEWLRVGEADALRIVACVNACEGINPEAVRDLLAAAMDVLESYRAMCLEGDQEVIERLFAAVAEAEK